MSKQQDAWFHARIVVVSPAVSRLAIGALSAALAFGGLSAPAFSGSSAAGSDAFSVVDPGPGTSSASGTRSASASGTSRQEDCSEGRQAGDQRPNIVLVSIDSLRQDHLGCYGYPKPTTPRIDAIASRGVLFETAISTTSWTLPAHAALFTGLYDSTHGVTSDQFKLGRDLPTLAGVLSDEGYSTTGFFSGPYLHQSFGLNRGFEDWHNCMSTPPPGLSEAELASSLAASHHDITGPEVAAGVADWITNAPRQPFFLFLHLWDVHYDYLPPPECVAMFESHYTGKLDATHLESNPAINASMSKRDLEHLIALYDGEIRFTDRVLGAIVQMLDRADLMRNTILVITADHGEEFFEHGQKGHQHSLYDEVIRIPLVFVWPGHLPAGIAIQDQVRLIDVMPTLLALAGVQDPPRTEGRDLSPLMRGGTLPPEPALSELLIEGADLRSLRTRTTKVMHSRRLGRTQGYDLARDPRELQPLPERIPFVHAGLVELERLTTEVEEAGLRVGPSPAHELDAALELRLRQLGYTGGDEDRPR
jgi:arylsulfatase A-like enzyme